MVLLYGLWYVWCERGPLEIFYIYLLLGYNNNNKNSCENDLFELVLLGYLVFSGLGCLPG